MYADQTCNTPDIRARSPLGSQDNLWTTVLASLDIICEVVLRPRSYVGEQFCLCLDCEIGRVTEECRTVSQVGDLDGNLLL